MGIITVTNKGSPVYKGQYDPAVVEKLREIPGAKFEKETKLWYLPWDGVEALQTMPQVSMDDQVKTAIEIRRERQRMVQALKEDREAVPLKPMPIKIKPFAHQVTAFNLGITLPNVALLKEMGTGKTLTAIAIAGRRMLDQGVTRCLVVAPLSVLSVWEQEIADVADFEFSTLELNSIGAVKERARALRNFTGVGLQFAITNYESVWRGDLLDAILEWKPHLVIADESQKIKGVSTKQAKAMHKIGDNTPYKMILTGTPVTASPLDFWSQYRFLEPEIFGKSYYAFRNRYAVLQRVEIPGRQAFQKVIGYRNKDELVKKAHSVAYRVTKEQTLDLPEWVDQKHYVYLEKKAAKYYQELKETAVAEIIEEQAQGTLVTNNVLTRLLRLQQLTGGFLPVEEGTYTCTQVSSAKVEALQDLLTDLLGSRGDKKVVVFARFKPELDLIRWMLGQNDWDHRFLSGDVKTADRTKAVEDFQQDPDVKVMVAQIQVAGLGLTLTAADTAVFYSMDFSFANYDQAKARLHRIGQTNRVTYLHLLAKGTVDEKVYKVLQEKRSVAEDVVDNWQKYLVDTA